MRTFLSIVACAVCLYQSQAQDTSRISLNTLLDRIEANYPSILQYQYNIQSIRAKADGAVSWMPPTVSTGIMRFPYDLSMLRETNNPMNQGGIVFSFEQMIPNASKLNAKKDYINSLADIEKAKGEWTKNELRREAKKLYYKRYVAERKRVVVKESEDLLLLLLTSAEGKYRNNQSQLQTIYKAKARLAELKNMLLMLNSSVDESSIGLNILMVRDVNTAFLIDTNIAPVNYSISLSDTGNVSNRSDVTALNRFIQSMKLEQYVMEIGTRPDFGVRGEHMQMFGMPNQWSVMVMMTLPFVPWASTMYSSEVDAIGYQIQSMEMEKKTMELMAKRMVTEKMTMLISENAQYQSYKQNIVPAYENNLQINMLSYGQNTGDFFVLLDAWEMLLMKKLETYDKLLSTLSLEAEYEYEKESK